jgi:hypothetical protein
LQIKSRAADDLEHFGGGGLLLQGFPQLTEQLRVLDVRWMPRCTPVG